MTVEDGEIINSLLNLQFREHEKGDVLEIGCYKGKSAVLLANWIQESAGERLYLCDVFTKSSLDKENASEVRKSYEDYSLGELQESLQSTTKLRDIRYIDSNSLNLPRILRRNNFRFIHIDGSHLYKVVIEDLTFAVEHLLNNKSIICLDDYRAQHALGVSKALWKSIDDLNVKVVLVGPGKIFLRKTSLSSDEIRFIEEYIHRANLKLLFIDEFEEQIGVVKSKLDLSYITGWKREILKRFIS